MSSTFSNSYPSSGPKVAVVLGSGGLKPVSSLPLLQFLSDRDIEIDLLVGCSGGSIMSGLWGMGYSQEEIVEITREFLNQKGFSAINYNTLMSIGKVPFFKFNLQQGLLKKKFPLAYCKKVFKDHRLESLNTKLVLQTTDIQTGRGIVLEHGPLAEAVYASSAMYPLLPPYKWEDKWLVDGALSAPLPVLEAVKRDADIIIAMIFNEKLVAEPSHFMQGLHNTIRSFSQALIRSQLSLAIDLHHFEIILINVSYDKPVSMNDPRQLEVLLEAGQQAVHDKEEEILNTIKHFGKAGTP